jgi:hypothetical protein
MTDKEKTERLVDIDELESLTNAYAAAHAKRKEYEAAAKQWKEAAEQFQEVIMKKLKEAGPADIYIGRIGGKPKVRLLIVDKESFLKDKFGESHPDLLEQYTMTIPGGGGVRFTVKPQ